MRDFQQFDKIGQGKTKLCKGFSAQHQFNTGVLNFKRHPKSSNDTYFFLFLFFLLKWLHTPYI